MSARALTAAGAALACAVGALVLILGGDDEPASQKPEAVPGQPSIDIIAPRNGSRQENRSVVVRIKVENFELAPERFGEAPQLGEGYLRFSLNRVPDCIDPEKLAVALSSPTGRGRFLGRSFDYPKYSGPEWTPRPPRRVRRPLLPLNRARDLLRAPAAGLLPPDDQPGAQ